LSIDRVLQLKLVADVGDINSKMATVTTQTSKLGSAFKTMTSFIGPVALTAALVAVEKLGEGISSGMEDARKFDDAVSGLTASLLPLGIAADEAQRLAESSAAAAASLGFADDDQVVRGLQAFAEQSGSAATAQLMLAAAMDLARLKGIPLEEAVSKVQAIYKGASRTLAEFGISGVSGMAAVNAALGDNSTAAETWATTTQGKYATTAAAIDDAFQALGTAINTALDTVILPALSELIPMIGNLWAQWQPALAAVGDGVAAFVGRVVEIWGKLQPTIQAFLDFVSPVLATFQAAVEMTFAAVTGVLDAIIALLNGDFTGAWNAITGVVQAMYDGVVGIVVGLIGWLSDIVGTFASVAGNLGSAIFEGITGGVRRVVGVVRDVANAVIGALNRINQFSWERQGFEVNTIAGNFFVGVGAGSIQLWPEIPMLAKGGIVNGPTLAMIGEAGPEAVVPLGRGGGLGNNYTINVNVAPGGDPVANGKAIVELIRQYERRSGAAWRS
jgi:phage-related protein